MWWGWCVWGWRGGGSYLIASHVIWDGYSFLLHKLNFGHRNNDFISRESYRPSGATTAAVHGLGAAMANGVSTVITMPLDTIKTSLQVLETEENQRRRAGSIVTQTAKSLVEDGGLRACYRGLGLRWASMAMSAAIMVATYEFLKKLSAKDQE